MEKYLLIITTLPSSSRTRLLSFERWVGNTTRLDHFFFVFLFSNYRLFFFFFFFWELSFMFLVLLSNEVGKYSKLDHFLFSFFFSLFFTFFFSFFFFNLITEEGEGFEALRKIKMSCQLSLLGFFYKFLLRAICGSPADKRAQWWGPQRIDRINSKKTH